MRALLDTHVVLWWLSDSNKLSKAATELISTDVNTCFVSAVSLWEIELKQAVGKLKIPPSFFSKFQDQDFVELVISYSHTRALGQLPDIHRDPFDRMLVAQAMVEGLTLMSRDRNILKYEVRTIEA